VGLARLAQSRNDVETVARHLQKARLNNKYALEPRLMLANYYQQKGDIKMALEVIREARDVAPERAQVLGVLGQVESAAGNHDEAIKAFSTLATLLPDNADEDVGHDGVELGAAVPQQLVHGIHAGHGAPVGAVRYHGLVGIGHGHDVLQLAQRHGRDGQQVHSEILSVRDNNCI